MFIALLIMFTLTIPNESSASNFREVKQLSADTYLRLAASPSAKTVTTLPKNTLVTQFNTVAGGWSYVQANQYKGYVPTSALKTKTSTIKIANSKSGLVVKETATRNSKTVANLKYNMIVEDFGSVGGGWSFVQYGNVTGYVNSSFIGTAKTSTKYVTGLGSYIVRNIASPSGASKGNVKGGTAVTVHSQISGWSYITTGSLRGYIPTSQLVSKKPVVQPQKLTSFTHLRPYNISWMKAYLGFLDFPVTYTTYLLDESYGNEYRYFSSYMPYYDEESIFYYGHGVPSFSFLPNHFYMTVMETDWSIGDLPVPLTQNQAVAIRSGYDESYILGNAFLRTTTGTLTTPAGTFTNVVHIEEKSFESSISTHYYFAPGYGLIKIESSTGELLFELRDYY